MEEWYCAVNAPVAFTVRKYVTNPSAAVRLTDRCIQKQLISNSARITNKVMGGLKVWRATASVKNFLGGPPKGSPNITKKYT
jgi:hypothetical protein